MENRRQYNEYISHASHAGIRRRPFVAMERNKTDKLIGLDGQYFLIFVLDGEKLQISFSSRACAAADALPR